jgi:hypothetical protein
VTDEDRTAAWAKIGSVERQRLADPKIELARNYQLSAQDLSRLLPLVIDHEQKIRDAWHRHFGR